MGIELELIKLCEADRREINCAVSRFAAQIDLSNEIVFCCASHGFEVVRRNNLSPADVRW
ncbi:MAG: hypothetical protein BM562_14760 [Alphaproteobacteria bacterium MedPE-SWcel]|nr:MAG: hypothetical protein BM562_14760 [Alphaproteobacteria bacterium MedPE-SWcel]